MIDHRRPNAALGAVYFNETQAHPTSGADADLDAWG
jgi:hypothetical protein